MRPGLSLSSFSPRSTELARRFPASFAQYVGHGRWKIAPHLALIQAYLFDLLGGVFDNLIINMPPRHGKSMFVTTRFPAWFLGNWPNKEVVITGYEAHFAADFGRQVRDLIEEFGEELFDVSVREDKRAAGSWLIKGIAEDGSPATGGLRTAGVGGALTGRGGDLIIIDDPVKNAEQARSEVYRNKLWDWYLSTLYTRREPGAKQICIMTRWNEDDLAARLVERAEEQEGQKWKVLNLPALCEDPENDPLGRELGDALWPERWPVEELLAIKGTMEGAYWWAAQYQGRPAPEEGNLFKRQWWKFWGPPGVALDPVRLDGCAEAMPVVPLPKMERRISSWDLAFKKGKATSYVVGQKWGQNGPNAFLLDQVRERMDFPETVDAFLHFHEKHADIQGKLVEDKANGPALIALCRKAVPGIVPVEPCGDKQVRWRGVAPYVKSGNVYLPHPAIAPWISDFINELSAVPNAAHDDQADGMSQALDELLGKVPKPGLLWGSSRVGVGR